ncbi:hypothetical protein HYT24_01840 [Candidatus Pacearchaeota archaeon]|nr:hypothetical protein [Candidatus Pacearchaeota archaeon]
MSNKLKAISKALNYRDWKSISSSRLDAVIAATGPAEWMDLARVDAAAETVSELYGYVGQFKGDWIVSGGLGNDAEGRPILYERSQRRNMIERLKSHGVPESQIVILEGRNNRDKVRELVRFMNDHPEKFMSPTDIPRYVGVASYPLDIARWNLALHQAKDEDFVTQRYTEIIGIPISTKNRPLRDYFTRSPDWVAGATGLYRDAKLFEEKGFRNATSAPASTIHKLARAANSEKPRQRFKDN